MTKSEYLRALLMVSQQRQVIKECCNADYGDYQRKKDETLEDCIKSYEQSKILKRQAILNGAVMEV